jgi:hypothetical protein
MKTLDCKIEGLSQDVVETLEELYRDHNSQIPPLNVVHAYGDEMEVVTTAHLEAFDREIEFGQRCTVCARIELIRGCDCRVDED